MKDKELKPTMCIHCGDTPNIYTHTISCYETRCCAIRLPEEKDAFYTSYKAAVNDWNEWNTRPTTKKERTTVGKKQGTKNIVYYRCVKCSSLVFRCDKYCRHCGKIDWNK